MERRTTPVTWALAPEWLTISEAAELSGFEPELLAWLIEKQSLRENQEALALVAN